MKLGLKFFDEDLEFEFGETVAIDQALEAALEAMANYGSDRAQMQLIGIMIAEIKATTSKTLDNRIEEDKKKNGNATTA